MAETSNRRSDAVAIEAIENRRVASQRLLPA